VGSSRGVVRWMGKLIWRIGRESMERIRCGMVGGEVVGVYIWDARYPIDQVIGLEFSSFFPFLLYGTVDFFTFFTWHR